MSAAVAVSGLTVDFDGHRVLAGIELTAEAGGWTTVIGPNGAGKTTTFRMTIGMIDRDDGRVIFNNTEVTGLPMYRHARLGMGYLSQEPSLPPKAGPRAVTMTSMRCWPTSTSSSRSAAARSPG